MITRILPSQIEPPFGGANPSLPSRLPPIKKAADLLGEKLPSPQELVKGFLHVGSTMVYGGGSKTNKTFALMDMAISVAAGVPWWGLETTQGNVLYMDFELQEVYFQKRLNAILSAKELRLSDIQNLDVWNLRGHASDLGELSPHILQRLQGHDYKLIILDPIYKVLGDRDENAAGDINSLMNELDLLAVESGAGIVIGHHFSKGGQAGKNSMDRISGSGVFARAPDAIVIITKHEQDNAYTVESTLRNFKPLEPFCVTFDYSLMTRNEDLDPSRLKKPGAMKEKFTGKQLLTALGNEELTTKEWEAKACDLFKMGIRTFANKKGDLVKSNQVTKVENDKWKATKLGDYKDTRTIIKRETDELQTATTANAPLAEVKDAVCATAAAALS